LYVKEKVVSPNNFDVQLTISITTVFKIIFYFLEGGNLKSKKDKKKFLPGKKTKNQTKKTTTKKKQIQKKKKTKGNAVAF
jgi:hypothetical protein